MAFIPETRPVSVVAPRRVCHGPYWAASMCEGIALGLHLAKNVFQGHGEDAKGRFAFSKTVRRGQVLDLFVRLTRCVVAIEARGGSHDWAREFGSRGHEVRVIAPVFLKRLLKRENNDAADAVAICEAALAAEHAVVRRQNIWRRSRRRLAECGPRLGVDVRRRACGVASADVRWSVA